LHRLLRNAVERYPTLAAANLPEEPARFRATFGDALVRFEAARLGCDARTDIAASIADEAFAALLFEDEAGNAIPLAQHFAARVEPLATTRVEFMGQPGLRLEVPYRGRVYAGAELGALGDELVERARATRAAADALRAVGTANGGVVDLRGRRVAVLGAKAELSPVHMLLQAGADVLWIDVQPPPATLLASNTLAGSLTYTESPADLLLAPNAVVATIAKFAGRAPVDLVLSAYAPGSGREWRLQAAMNAIVRALDPALVRSVGLYISPTTPAALQPDEVKAAARYAERVPAWQRALAVTGALRGQPFANGDVHVARALVPVQGVSYQAAQYVEKILAAERFALRGTRDGATPPRVSANVAPITMTRSLEHPLFKAGFIGAIHLGVEVFEPDTTRALSGAVLLADFLGVGPRRAGDPIDVFSRQVHGGVFTMAYGLNEAIRVAAVLGMTSRPGLLVDLFRKRRPS
jgi:hypothetical protein